LQGFARPARLPPRLERRELRCARSESHATLRGGTWTAEAGSSHLPAISPLRPSAPPPSRASRSTRSLSHRFSFWVPAWLPWPAFCVRGDGGGSERSGHCALGRPCTHALVSAILPTKSRSKRHRHTAHLPSRVSSGPICSRGTALAERRGPWINCAVQSSTTSKFKDPKSRRRCAQRASKLRATLIQAASAGFLH
jgi:hypothetical protein